VPVFKSQLIDQASGINAPMHTPAKIKELAHLVTIEFKEIFQFNIL
jgi:hypothetical protein